MNFRNVGLKSEYDSVTDNVYDDFFNKILKFSKSYSRIGGNFTSKNLAACAEGLQEFIQKDGRMKLVLMPVFNSEDVDAINTGIKKTHDVISECWIKDFAEVQEKFVADHTKALAWMLANDHLEIKIVVPVDSSGSILSETKLTDSQIFKRKTGIFWDADNESVSFSGNVDFDDKMFGEYHHFRVYRSWDESEKKYLDKDYEEFCKYWDGYKIEAGVTLKTIPLPDAIKNNLIKIAPKSKSEINLQNMPRLRPYQKNAVNAWLENDCRGIFEMATGTGKTFTAIGCLDELRKKNKKLQVVIVCPFDNLERQWQKELAKWGFDSSVTSGNQKWGQNLNDRLASLELSKKINLSIVITTYKTFCTEKFVKIIENSNIPLLLISDEVHNAGAASHSKGLTNAYHYRLGLSATLERYFDPEGTLMLQKFFGDTVYELNLAQAIKKGFLVGYYYYPISVDLEDEEYEKYRSYTKMIARLWHSKLKTDKERLEHTLINRSRIIQNAENKLVKFKELVVQHQNAIKYALVYCSEKQMPTIKKILNRIEIVNCEITHANPSDPKKRAEILKQFSDGLYDVIVANRVLDEGADIPSARTCIMLASTGNPKQFIQRRGRVLRRFNENYNDGSKKEYAVIHDILVIPEISSDYTDDEIRVERQIVASQVKRLENMAHVAINSGSCLKEIDALKRKFSIE